MRPWVTGALLAGSLALSGCFEMKQDFRFKSDETAEVTIRIALDAALIALANEDASKPFCGDDMIEKDGITSTVTSTTEGGDTVCTIRMSGPIATVVEAAANAQVNEKANEKPGVSLTQNGSVYTLQIEIPPFGDNKPDDDNPMAQSMQALMLAKMSGRTLAWTVTAPQIIETSGTVSGDKTTASYSRPLAEAFISKDPTRFSAKFSLEEPGFFGWIKGWFQ